MAKAQVKSKNCMLSPYNIWNQVSGISQANGWTIYYIQKKGNYSIIYNRIYSLLVQKLPPRLTLGGTLWIHIKPLFGSVVVGTWETAPFKFILPKHTRKSPLPMVLLVFWETFAGIGLSFKNLRNCLRGNTNLGKENVISNPLIQKVV